MSGYESDPAGPSPPGECPRRSGPPGGAGRPAGLVVFSDDWGRHPSSCQHLVRHLLGRHEVAWVNTIGMRPPRLDAATLGRGLEKVRGWMRPRRAPGALPGNLRVCDPTMWPWFRTRLDRRINRALLGRQLASATAALPAPCVAVTTLPIAADLIGVLPVERWVYYCVDDFGQWPGLDQAALRRLEELLVRRADTIIAASEALRARLRGLGRSAHLLTHGVDLDHWRPGGDQGPLPGVEGLERPLVVFWGLVDRRLDLSWLRRLAGDLAAGTILLVGPESGPDPGLTSLARVVRAPALPYEQLPRLARRSDVLIMPYADLPVTRAMQPLKLKEYLATGRPAVVRDLPANRDWSDCLDLADTPESFSAAVRLRLATGLPEAQRRARRRLAEESWSRKACAFARWVFPDRGDG